MGEFLTISDAKLWHVTIVKFAAKYHVTAGIAFRSLEGL